MTVLVCGGRDFNDWPSFLDAMDTVDERFGIRRIVHGAAPGADTLAQRWADLRSRRFSSYPANWKEHGYAAGPKRNQRMLDAEKPDLVVAFPGGRGTADMVRRAKAAGVEVREIKTTQGKKEP